jgi:uncharacterized membrane protein (DUF2068 family)
VATASFVPIEIFEVLQRVSLPRVTALVLNLLVVAYLIYRLRRSRAEDHAASSLGSIRESKDSPAWE